MRWCCVCACLLVVSLSACRSDTLFEKLSPARTGIDFTNTIVEDSIHNVFTYQYYYNGNGVAVGDVNNDGLADLFFTGNQTPSKLYLNKGALRFEDITATAGVAGKKGWRTGATMVDLNADGLLDIFVCYSGFGTDEDRAKQLFINTGIDRNGVPRFVEQAAAYGLEAPGTYTSHAAFFDFDKDGDLDVFFLNHADGFYAPFFNTTKLRNLRHPRFGNRLYRNEGGKFTDVSTEAGIYGSGINFGLGIAISDLNMDGWPDIFVSNDFHEQDFCYLNNKDGTFTDVCKQVFGHFSRNTMGVDIADYNNDLLPDIVALDMLPESNYRQKILQGPDEYDKYQLMVDSGYGHQLNRNVLQLHRGLGYDSLPVFSEIGQLAGVSNTDWSWASLLADFDNDGWKDLFITNGYLRETTNLDFIKYNVQKAYDEALQKGLDLSTRESYERNMPLYDLVKKMPAAKLSNYVFRNERNLLFSDASASWGVNEPGVSSGAAYGDLDNDGDLDLIVCNNNAPVWIYQNRANDDHQQSFIRIRLEGKGSNRYGIGARVYVATDSLRQVQEMYPVRGYQSSVDYVLHFGLGNAKRVNEIRVVWGNDSVSLIREPAINTTITIKAAEASATDGILHQQTFLYEDITRESGVDFSHRENRWVDFKREFLMPYQLSRQGPKLSKGDVNGDGLIDFYIGGAAEHAAALYVQNSRGYFEKKSAATWQEDAIYEDVASVFFDADGDNDLDLYVVSGGSEWAGNVPGLQDRLYLNDGSGQFQKAAAALPKETYSGSCVRAMDFDKDGDMDLFVGARIVPGNYPNSVGSMLLRNELKPSGKVAFTDVTHALGGKDFSAMGMVTDACFADVTRDGWPDLVVTGDWMPVRLFRNEQGSRFTEITANAGLQQSDGWWCSLTPADVDNDGDIDFIAGNLGLNTAFKVSANEPLVTYTADFNQDGKPDPLMTWYVQGKSFPFNTRDELVEQMPALNKKFLLYEQYAKATLPEIVSQEQMERSQKHFIYHTSSALLINRDGKFDIQPLPVEAQFSVGSAMLYDDFDSDGLKDILLAGNFFPFRVQQGRCDAGIGLLLRGNGKGSFTPVPATRSGLYITGDVRDMIEVNGKIIISKNDDGVQVLRRSLREP